MVKATFKAKITQSSCFQAYKDDPINISHAFSSKLAFNGWRKKNCCISWKKNNSISAQLWSLTRQISPGGFFPFYLAQSLLRLGCLRSHFTELLLAPPDSQRQLVELIVQAPTSLSSLSLPPFYLSLSLSLSLSSLSLTLSHSLSILGAYYSKSATTEGGYSKLERLFRPVTHYAGGANNKLVCTTEAFSLSLSRSLSSRSCMTREDFAAYR